MNLTTILDDCLQRLAAGESVAQCLARYPEAALELAPMLTAAEQLRAFSAVHLNQGQRLRAKVALREELAAQGARRAPAAASLGIRWPRWGLAPLAALVAVVLFSSVAFSAVAASQPGDFVYPVRIAVERAPVWFRFSADGRVTAELALAERRLHEITREGQAHQVALDALLRSDAEAVERAEALSEAGRAEVAMRIAEHADQLARLAGQATDPAISGALAQAARDAQALAGRLADIVALPPDAPAATASLTPGQTPPPSATPLPVFVPTLAYTPALTPISSPAVPTVPPIPTAPTVVVSPIATVPTVAPPPVQTTAAPPSMTPTPSPQPTSRRTDIIVTPRRTAVATRTPWPTVAIPPQLTVVVPTVVVPTVVIPAPHTPRPLPTGAATQAVETPAPTPTIVAPTFPAPTVVAPTMAPPPTIRPPGAQLTATVVWLTMTPPPTPTPRPIIRLTVTLTVLPPRQTATPAATATPPAPPTEMPGATATPAGEVLPSPTSESLETAMPAGTPTAPPVPR